MEGESRAQPKYSCAVKPWGLTHPATSPGLLSALPETGHEFMPVAFSFLKCEHFAYLIQQVVP